MELRFFHDPESDEPHIYRHGVTESEVEEVLAKPGETRNGSDQSKIAIGQTESGRYLKVVYVPDEGPGSVFVVTAFEPGPSVLRAYRRRMDKKK